MAGTIAESFPWIAIENMYAMENNEDYVNDAFIWLRYSRYKE